MELEEKNPDAETIYCILDNARYYRALIVKEYLKTSKIELVFLPSYSPNLNLIERLWKFYRKKFYTTSITQTWQSLKPLPWIFLRTCLFTGKNWRLS
jgi:transposase